MPWFFVDDAFADSKPVMQLDARIRNEAVGLWVRCGAWSAKEETDGRVPIDVVKGFGGSPRIIRALHDQAELWTGFSSDSDQNLTKFSSNSRQILFKNWSKWQKTKAENEARRKREAEKKQTWRSGKKGRDYVSSSDDVVVSTGDKSVDTNGGSKVVSTGESTGVSTGESRYPDPTRPDPTLIPLETSGGKGTLGDARDAPRPPKCDRHEENSDVPCRACQRRRVWDEGHAGEVAADVLARRRALKAAELVALGECRVCDDHGWVLGSDGTPVEPALKCSQHLGVQHA